MASDDISRLYDFVASTTISSDQVDAELNQLVTACNGKAGRSVNNSFSGNNTFAGNDTFTGLPSFSNTSGLKTDTITERSSGVGVTIDSLLIKDAGIIFTDAGELTIASGEITATGTFHTVDTEGDAASDDLTTINGGTAGRFLVIQAEDDARSVVIKHNTGNIITGNGQDVTLDEDDKTACFIYSAAISKWCQIGGQISLASTATTQTGTSTTEAVTPAGLAATMAWKHVGVATVSGASQVAITGIAQDKIYRMFGWLQPATDNVDILFRTGTSGSTLDSSGYDSKVRDLAEATSSASVEMTRVGAGNATREAIYFELTFYQKTGEYTFIQGKSAYLNNATAIENVDFGGVRASTTNTVVVGVQASSGNITGTIYLQEMRMS